MREITYTIVNECWICNSYIASKDGYIYVNVNGKQVGLHRYQYQKYKGDIPEGLLIRHTCDNKLCINPEHLILGTHKDNSQDMVQRGRSMRNGKIHNTKLTIDQVKEIKLQLKNGKYGIQKQLAEKYNVCKQTINDIKRGKIWSYIKL